MNILIVVPWDQEYGGVASVVGNLAIYLKGRGHKVFFFHPNAKAIIQEKRTTKWGFPGFRLRLGLPSEVHPFLSTLAFCVLFPFTLLQLIQLIKKHDIEIVNIHYPVDYFFYFSLCRRICRFPLVTSIHGADVFPRGKPKREYTLPFRFLLDSSDALVAPSRGFQSEFLQIFPELRSKGKVIYNGINIDELAAESNHGGRILKDPYILCIAMHNEKKGLDVLLHAFKQVRNSFPRFKLVLIGDGPLRNSLEELADSLGLQEQVVFCGMQGRPEVTNILRGCEVFVLPSRSEPFGIVILEAMACKKPVIATKVAGPMEIIEDGITGILVEADNPDMLAKAMINMLNRRDLQLFLGENGRLMVQEKFLSIHLGLAYEELFRKLLTQV